MDIQALTALFNVQQLDATAVRGLQLSAGQEMFATILSMVDDHVMLDMGNGQRLTATVQTDQPLQPGQVIQLQVTEASQNLVTLRLMPPGASTGQESQAAINQFLQSIGVPDDAFNRQALMALMADAQPVTVEGLDELRTLAQSLQSATPEDVRAIVYLLARDLPVTPAMVDVVRQGLSGGNDPVALGDRARDLASQLSSLLSATSSETDTGGLDADLRQLLTQLPAPTGGQPPSPAGLRSAMEQLISTVEHELSKLIDDRPTAEPSVRTATAGGSTTPPPPGTAAEAEPARAGGPLVAAATASGEGTAAQPPATAAAGEPPVSEATGQSAPAPTSPGASSPSGVATPAGAQLDANATGAPTPISSQQPGAIGAVDQPRAADSVQPPTVLPGTIDSRQASSHAAGSGPATSAQPGLSAPSILPPTSGPANAAHDQSGVVLPLPHSAGVDTQLAARQLIDRLDTVLTSGTLNQNQQPVAAALRDTLQQFVQTVQFHQIENSAAPTPTLGVNYLTFPLPLGDGQTFRQADLSITYKEEGGARRIDPNDVQVVVQLDLSQLKRVTIALHLLQRQIACTIEAENPDVERILAGAAPELRTNLQKLGYAVEPIRCTLAVPGAAGPSRTAGTPIRAALGRVNVQA